MVLLALLRKRGIVLSLDAFVAVSVAVILFTYVVVTLGAGVSYDAQSVSVALPLFMNSAQGMGVLDTAIRDDNVSVLDEVIADAASVFCGNITVLDSDDVLVLTAQGIGCVPHDNMYAYTQFLDVDGTSYVVRSLGWKQ